MAGNNAIHLGKRSYFRNRGKNRKPFLDDSLAYLIIFPRAVNFGNFQLSKSTGQDVFLHGQLRHADLQLAEIRPWAFVQLRHAHLAHPLLKR